MTVSAEFWAFAALFFLLYYCLPRRAQPTLLLLGSLLFYGFGGWLTLSVPLWLTLVSWSFGRVLTRVRRRDGERIAACGDASVRRLLRERLERKKGWLTVPGVLLLFAPFLLWRWMGNTLFGLYPLGIAYMTLSATGYLTDVKRGEVQNVQNPLSLLLFLVYFPALWQGPVSRFGELYPQLLAPHAFSPERAGEGGIRLLWGLFKKLVVADTAALLCASLQPGRIGLLALLYTVRVYGDFTGGMDISLGISHALGISLYENFDRPFSSPSLAVYWRRWHRSLGRWLTDYVFYPLSTAAWTYRATDVCRRIFGERIGLRLPLYASVLLTWCAAGLWHGFGWNFLLWGLCNGVCLLLFREAEPITTRWKNRLPSKIKPLCRGASVLFTVALAGVFRLLDLCGTGAPLLTGAGDAPAVLWWVAGIAAVGMFYAESRRPFAESGAETAEARLLRRPYLAAICMALLLAVILTFGQYGVGYDVRDFIYGR